MRTLNIFLVVFILLSILFIGCDDEECDFVTPPTDDRIPFQINFLDYSDNNYFIDEVYTDTSSELNIYNHYYGNFPPEYLQNYYVKDIAIYKTTNKVGQSAIFAHCYIDLPSRSSSEKYPDSLRDYSNPIILGQHEYSRFKLLSEGGDYFLQRETGYINFVTTVNETDIIAIAYRIENENPYDYDDLIYGEFIDDLIHNSDTVAVLKLIKPQNLQPNYETAWKLWMKNMYQILPYPSQITDLDLDIYLKKADGTESNTINNIRLLELFGLDKIDEYGVLGPDGKFDYTLLFKSGTSEIIFPVIEPFGGNIPPELSEYKYQAIYDTFKTYVPLPDNYFIIKGKYKPI